VYYYSGGRGGKKEGWYLPGGVFHYTTALSDAAAGGTGFPGLRTV
jgi:hypothetical protein